MERMDNDVIFLNNEESQAIIRIDDNGIKVYYKYIKCSNKLLGKQRYFRCHKKCGASININESGNVSHRAGKHNHEDISSCEVACELEIVRIIQTIYEKPIVNLNQEYQSSRDKLLQHYKIEEISLYLKNFMQIRSKFTYHQKMAKSGREFEL
jgi:hypothetical protein